MFVTNKTNGPLGVDGVIILRPLEQARFVPDEDDYKRRVDRLVAADKVSVDSAEGLVKYNVVKDEPEQEDVKVVEAKVVAKEDHKEDPKEAPKPEPSQPKKTKTTSKTTEVI